ncbi:antibiotic biosynthesis monooxygenase [Streptomyces sp. ME02-8801-2C]|uniref:antibiotic biosynthesis monooxygenase family protein n=1 Tax=Streptomyces sp. ME02-8801-2C TaxID=3028680 RepID=UPI0029AD6895|nr:antibiotic biosynthesis monooxygenase [Streptomyces sp. ME02-8801-2C]MDX3455304.1 antibiotic biosynthesis monooxygenase [Streptomyces sp. ME02-8801-2C]
MTTSFARPEPPYYAVIITTRPAEDLEGYAAMSERMAELGEAQPGYLGRESMTDEQGRDLVVIYYTDEAAITAWKAHPEHLEAQRLGRQRWYSSYSVEVARVERAYAYSRD